MEIKVIATRYRQLIERNCKRIKTHFQYIFNIQFKDFPKRSAHSLNDLSHSQWISFNLQLDVEFGNLPKFRRNNWISLAPSTRHSSYIKLVKILKQTISAFYLFLHLNSNDFYSSIFLLFSLTFNIVISPHSLELESQISIRKSVFTFCN